MNKSIYQKLVENNVSLNDVNTIVHAGAGTCVEANFYNELSPKQVLLLEAGKNQAELLENTLQSQNNQFTVINKALVPDEATNNVDFYLTLPAQFSGIEEPFNIKKIFKNLKTINKVSAPSITLDELVEEFAIDANQENILVLQVNGAEENILSNVSNEVLSVFDVIVVQAIKRSLKISPQFESNIESDLLSLNYDLALSEEHDLIFENHIYVLDKQKQHIKKLQQKVSELNSEKNKLLSESKALDEKLLESNTQFNADLTEKKTLKENLVQQTAIANDFRSKVDVLEATVSQQENKITHLVSSNNEQREAIKLAYQKHKTEKETLEKNTQEQINEIANQLSASEEALEAKIVFIEELNAKVAALDTQVKKITNEREQQKNWHFENKNWAEDLKKQLENTTKTLDSEKQQSTALKEKLAQSKNELELLKQSLAETKKHNASVITELESNSADLNSKVITLKEANAQLEQKLNALVGDRDEKQVQFEKHKTWAESLNKQVEQLTTDLTEKARSTNLGQKMLAKAQIDLDGLRHSYTEKVENEKELVELVKELREKLTLASRYYIKMQQDHPELLSAKNDVTGN